MAMGKAESIMEAANLAASVIQLLRGHPGATATGSVAGGLGGIVRAIGRVATSLGFTKGDETALAMVLARLTPSELKRWTLIQRRLSDDEKEFLRVVIALMEEGGIIEQKKVKKDDDAAANHGRTGDIRLEFVRNICGLLPEAEGPAQEAAAEEVARMLRENNLVGSERSFERFHKMRGWLERQVAGILGVEHFSQVSAELVRIKAAEWNSRLGEKAPERRGILERLVGLTILGPQTPAKPFTFKRR